MDIPQVISSADAAVGEMGQGYLVSGKNVDLRRWDEDAGNACQSTCRQYETVGYLISGQMEIEIDGQCATLKAGDSWLVPAGAPHHYRIIEKIVAIEATSPPGRFQHKDE